MRHLPITTCLTAALLTFAACGGDDDSAGDVGDADTAEASEDVATQGDVATDDAPVPADDSAGAGDAGASSGGNGTASLELANGESFEFTILCSLESQMAAGSEILFTVVSYDDPGLDTTQFGNEGTITGSANITVYASDETLWDAGTLYDPFGGTIDLSLDGSNVTGTGSFYPTGDIQAEPVDGEVIANC